MIFIKFVTAVAALLLVWRLFALWHAGRELKRCPRYSFFLAYHRRVLWQVVGLTLGAVALIEIAIQVSADPSVVNGWLLAFHLSFVGLLVMVFFAVLLRFNGLRSPAWHGRFAYSFLALYGVVIASGLPLLYQLH